MIKIQNFILVINTVLIWLIVILVLLYLKLRDKDKKLSKINKNRQKFKLNFKIQWLESLDNYLKESGYFFIPETYILIHLMAAVLIFYGSIKLGFYQASKTIIPILIMLIVIANVLILKRASDRKNRIRLELTNIQDVMYFQNKIGTSEDIIFTYASQIAKPPLKEPLEYLATAPKVKKRIEKALDDLRSVSSIVELQSFSFIIQQRQSTGNSTEGHKAQALMMKRNKRLRRRINRQYKRTKLVVASLLLFSCYVLLLTVPLLQEIWRSLDLLFK